MKTILDLIGELQPGESLTVENNKFTRSIEFLFYKSTESDDVGLNLVLSLRFIKDARDLENHVSAELEKIISEVRKQASGEA